MNRFLLLGLAVLMAGCAGEQPPAPDDCEGTTDFYRYRVCHKVDGSDECATFQIQDNPTPPAPNPDSGCFYMRPKEGDLLSWCGDLRIERLGIDRMPKCIMAPDLDMEEVWQGISEDCVRRMWKLGTLCDCKDHPLECLDEYPDDLAPPGWDKP